ncbi:MAG: type II toxin-antitoxin system HipA family toxin [Acidobacteriaceae bacterium]
MTSKPPKECFVSITLPGIHTPVTAGRFVIEQTPTGEPLGRFVYGRSYLANRDAVEIDPVELKLSERTYETTRLSGVFGAIRDAGPDYWGRRIIEKHAGLSKLDELDYLLESPDDRAGALGFGIDVKPPAPLRKFNQTLDLPHLQKTAEALLRDGIPEDANAPQIQDLLLLGTSMGGTRPKAVVEDQEGLWIAKFERPDDRWNWERVEHAMLRLARQCGVDAAESRVERVGGKDVLMVKRFDRTRSEDRTTYLRSRMISALTLLRADDAVSARKRWSYVLLVEEIRRVVSEPKKAARELFRRIAFNALISNTDDHPRNHSLIAPGRDWMLSPAYDLTPTPSLSQERRDLAMECGALGRYANRANILSEHRRFLLEREEAERILDDMMKQIANTWEETVLSCGGSQHDVEAIRPAFVYPGYSL